MMSKCRSTKVAGLCFTVLPVSNIAGWLDSDHPGAASAIVVATSLAPRTFPEVSSFRSAARSNTRKAVEMLTISCVIRMTPAAEAFEDHDAAGKIGKSINCRT
jgi:hypothetical protein